MSDSLGGFDFTGSIFGGGGFGGFGGTDVSGFDPSMFGEGGISLPSDAQNPSGSPFSPFLGATTADTSTVAPSRDAALDQAYAELQHPGTGPNLPASALPNPDGSTPTTDQQLAATIFGPGGFGAFGGTDVGGFGSTALIPTGGDQPAASPGVLAQLNNWLESLGAPSGGSGGPGGSGGTPGGSGQSGAFAEKLKTALSGLQGIAKGPTPVPSGQPGSAWPMGRPYVQGVPAPGQVTSRGAQVPAILPSTLAALQARQQQYLQMGGGLPNSAPGGGLLGM